RMSFSDDMATMAPAWNTWSKSAGTSSSGSRPRSHETHTTPIASSASREPGSVKRASPQTSFVVASSRTIGLATWPAGPVTRILLLSMAPHHPHRHEAPVPALVGELDQQRQAIARVADRLDGGDERSDQTRRHVVDVEAVEGGT